MTSTSRAVHHGWKQNRREHHNDDGGNNDVHWSCGAAPYLNIGMSGSQSGSLPFSPTQSQVPPNKISTKAEQNLVLREQGTCYCGSAYYGVPSRFASKHKRQDYHFLFFFSPFLLFLFPLPRVAHLWVFTLVCFDKLTTLIAAGTLGTWKQWPSQPLVELRGKKKKRNLAALSWGSY